MPERPARRRYQLLDQQPELVVLGAPRPCQACGEPCWTATPRQRTKGTHPTCFHDDWRWGLTPAAEMRAIGVFQRVFPLASWDPSKPKPEKDPGPRTWHSDIPCAYCGIHDDVVVYRGCREYQQPYSVYRCFAHPPIKGFPPQSWEVQAPWS